MKLVYYFVLLSLFFTNTIRSFPAEITRRNQEFENFPEPVASYNIQLRLDVIQKQIMGIENISFRNTSEDVITDLVFHLYLNAFRDVKSILLSENPIFKGYPWDPDFPGWIEVEEIHTIEGTPLTLKLLDDGTIGRIDLPKPVQPGETIELLLSFRAQLPKAYMRTGYAGASTGFDFFLVGQWFPKLGVWQNGEWNAHPFHANSEFFSDFGTYDVEINLPEGYITGGVGELRNVKKNQDGTQTVSYRAQGVIDFAWTASPHFNQISRMVDEVELVYLVLPEHSWSVDRVLDAAELAIRSFGDWYGPYPYQRLTLVDVPEDGAGAGGMEYPTFVTIGTAGFLGLGGLPSRLGLERDIEFVTIHEIAHQWWQSLVAFNEAEEPWLDEGFADYSTIRLIENAYSPKLPAIKLGSMQTNIIELRRSEYLSNPTVNMNAYAWDFDPLEYGVAAYSKPSMGLLTLENYLGEEVMMEIMQAFFQEYQYKHPTREDFHEIAERIAGRNINWFFTDYVESGKVLDYSAKAIYENEAIFEREGDLVIPTEVVVEFSDGSQFVESWDGVDRLKKIEFEEGKEIKSIEVDPDRKIVIDLAWSNNSLRQKADFGSWFTISTRLLYIVQSLLLTLGGL